MLPGDSISIEDLQNARDKHGPSNEKPKPKERKVQATSSSSSDESDVGVMDLESGSEDVDESEDVGESKDVGESENVGENKDIGSNYVFPKTCFPVVLFPYQIKVPQLTVWKSC